MRYVPCTEIRTHVTTWGRTLLVLAGGTCGAALKRFIRSHAGELIRYPSGRFEEANDVVGIDPGLNGWSRFILVRLV